MNINDQFVRDTMQSILERHSNLVFVVPAPDTNLLGWFQKVRDTAGLTPYVRISQPHLNLSQVCFRNGDLDLFFFVNSDLNQKMKFRADFDIQNRSCNINDTKKARCKNGKKV